MAIVKSEVWLAPQQETLCGVLKDYPEQGVIYFGSSPESLVKVNVVYGESILGIRLYPKIRGTPDFRGPRNQRYLYAKILKKTFPN